MKTKLLAAAICSLALSACDFEQRPDSASDQGGAGVTQPGRTGAPMSPATPPGSGASRTAPPAGGGSTPAQ
jgi:hypothetical protein